MKRFVINDEMVLEDKIETYELSCIVDTENKSFYFIVNNIANVESFIERLNKLNDENQSLIEENKFLRNKVATYKSGNALLKRRLDEERK